MQVEVSTDAPVTRSDPKIREPHVTQALGDNNILMLDTIITLFVGSTWSDTSGLQSWPGKQKNIQRDIGTWDTRFGSNETESPPLITMASG